LGVLSGTGTGTNVDGGGLDLGLEKSIRPLGRGLSFTRLGGPCCGKDVLSIPLGLNGLTLQR